MTADIIYTIFGSVAGFALTLINAWLLFMVKNIRDDINSLRGADITIATKLAGVEVLVAGNYVTRVEFNAALDRQTSTILRAIRKSSDLDATMS